MMYHSKGYMLLVIKGRKYMFDHMSESVQNPSHHTITVIVGCACDAYRLQNLSAIVSTLSPYKEPSGIILRHYFRAVI